MILHDASSGTTAHGPCAFFCGTIVTFVESSFFVVNTFAKQFCSSIGTAVTRVHVLCFVVDLELYFFVETFLLLLYHACGSHLVHGPGLEYS